MKRYMCYVNPVVLEITFISNYKWRNLRLNIHLSVCLLIFSTTIHLINFKLHRCIAEDPRKCNVACEVFWTSELEKASDIIFLHVT